MNRIDLQQAGGFPLETDTLGWLQEASSTLNALNALGGDDYIVSGCLPSGNNIGSGYVVAGGELLPFKGALKQSTVIIKEEAFTRPFENGQTKNVFYRRYATFGTGSNTLVWSDFVRLKPLKAFRSLPHQHSDAIDLDSAETLATSKAVKEVADMARNAMPKGAVIMWSGDVNMIPTGFALCDGQNKTPDLRGRFIMGYDARKPDYNAIGKTGGVEKVTLTVPQVPSHVHSGYTSSAGKHTHDVNTAGDRHLDNSTTCRVVQSHVDFASGPYSFDLTYNGEHSHSFTTYSTGGNQSHENRSPYYVLAYIIKI